MVKGYRREVVILRGTERDCFTEAYFLLRETNRKSHSDLVAEANRILADCNVAEGRTEHRRLWYGVACFLAGVAVTVGACALLSVL